jgi:indolepyruvate ferredoxin oxidoreductase, beta subunit
VFDHFKPGVPEFAALLPNRLAQRLLAWDRARTARGLDPWALPLKIGTHTVLGAAALRFVAALKGLRRRGSRFALEQQLMERWLKAVEHGLREHPALGLEVARCGRLIKGYGSTNERGKDNLLHIIEHLAATSGVSPAHAERPSPAENRAKAVREARQAALADDAGKALDQTLQAHGVPPRAPRDGSRCDGQVFASCHGAQSYYAARGFRGWLPVWNHQRQTRHPSSASSTAA